MSVEAGKNSIYALNFFTKEKYLEILKHNLININGLTESVLS